MKKIILSITVCVLLFQLQTNAQITSELKSFQLEILDSSVPSKGAFFSIDGFKIQDDFNFSNGAAGTLSAGNDLRQSTINEFGLVVSENLVDPSRFSTFDIDGLNFNFFESFTSGIDNWSVFTSPVGTNRRSLTISETFGSDAIATEVGIFLAPWELSEGGINVGIGTDTPTERLEVDGAVKVNQTTSEPEPNVLYGNSLPISYGRYNHTSDDFSGYGITSITKTAVGRYSIVYDNATAGATQFIATPFDTNTVGFISHFPPNSNTINVRTTDINGNDTDRSFSFVIFGTPQ